MKNVRHETKDNYCEVIKLQKDTKSLDAFDIFILYFSTGNKANKGNACVT